jgi:hypothetical protein
MKKMKLSEIRKINDRASIKAIDKKIKELVQAEYGFSSGRKKPRDPEKAIILDSFNNK